MPLAKKNQDELDPYSDLDTTSTAPTSAYELVDFPSAREIPPRPNRHTVSAAAVLSTDEVLSLLGGRAAVTRQWLRRVRPLPHPSGRRVYLWSDVLAALKEVA